MKNLYTLLFILSLSLTSNSCTLFIRASESNEEKWVVVPITEKTYCASAERKNISLVNSNLTAQTGFWEFQQRLMKKKISLSFIEISVLWSLVQMNVRPDQSSPTSGFQVLINFNGEQQYWDFRMSPFYKLFNKLKDEEARLQSELLVKQKKNSLSLQDQDQKTKEKLRQKKEKIKKKVVDNSFLPLPFLFGLEFLLTKYGSKKGLLQLIHILENNYPFPVLVEEEFQWFLNSMQGPILGVPLFKDFYFKEDEVLKKSESLPRPPYERILNAYEASKKNINFKNFYNVDNTLTPYQTEQNKEEIEVRCGINLKAYEKSIYLVSQDIPSYNLFGYQSQQGNSFLAYTAQTVASIAPLMESLFFHGIANIKKGPFCLLKSKPQSKGRHPFQISLMSTRSRDPGQHLYQLIKNHFHEIESIEDLDEKLKGPRHLFLLNPIRLAYESKRGDPKQLEKLLMLDLPIYHASQLGNIWAHANFFQDKDFGFVIDERYKGQISCSTP